MKITIHPYQFTLREPFTAGDEITPALASWLNLHRAQAIVKLLRPEIDEQSYQLLDVEAMRNLTERVEKLDAQYWLPKLPALREPWSLQEEIQITARELAVPEAKRLGCDPDALALELESHEDVQFLARHRFKTKLRVAEAGLDDLLAEKWD